MSRGIVPDPWEALRRHTPARLALGRAGDSLPTAALLEFGFAQARARDAVHTALDVEALERGLQALGLIEEERGALRVHSAAADRSVYLRRPDLGRGLDAASRGRLEAERARRGAAGAGAPQLVLVIADGLSASAVNRHALPVLAALLPLLVDLRLAPPVIALEARVALGDAVAELLGAGQVAVFIGERPGLSAPDSLGIYLTHEPRVGRTDAERNCISNIRPDGLDYAEAARRLALLLAGARRLGRSGVALKDESDEAGIDRQRQVRLGPSEDPRSAPR